MENNEQTADVLAALLQRLDKVWARRSIPLWRFKKSLEGKSREDKIRRLKRAIREQEKRSRIANNTSKF